MADRAPDAMTGIRGRAARAHLRRPEGCHRAHPKPTPSASSSRAPPPAGPSRAPLNAGPTATPPPTYGPLEMVYLARATAGRRSASRGAISARPWTDRVVRTPRVDDYVWAPDGGSGPRSSMPGRGPGPRTATPNLIDPVDALAFADDSTHALRDPHRAGRGERPADVLAIDFTTGGRSVTPSLSAPEIFSDPPLKEAQFATTAASLARATVADTSSPDPRGPSTYRIDRQTGPTSRRRGAILWPRTSRRGSGGGSAHEHVTSALGGRGAGHGQRDWPGSHVRWAGTNNEVVFTLAAWSAGRATGPLHLGPGRRQGAIALTSNGASFGAEWLGVPQSGCHETDLEVVNPIAVELDDTGA